MRTANNNSNFTVEALVAKYRNFVMEHASYEVIGADNDSDFIGSAEYGLDGWPDHQLLISIYNDVAGKDADKTIQEKLSKYVPYFKKDIFSEAEYAFLCTNFKETVEYLFSKGLMYGSESSSNSIQLIKSDVTFIKKASQHIDAKPGKRLFIESDTFGDGAVLFPQCVIFCNKTISEEDALKKIRLYAAGIQYREFDKIKDEEVDIVILGRGCFPGMFVDAPIMYSILANEGTMIMEAHPFYMASSEEEAESFREVLVSEKTLKSIIKYSENNWSVRYVIIIEKKRHSEVIVKDNINHLSCTVPSGKISSTNFLPGFYLVEKPENGIPLSELLDNYDFNSIEQFISVEQTLVFPQNLGTTFKDVNINQKEILSRPKYVQTPDDPSLDCYNVDFPSILLYGGRRNLYVGITSECLVPFAVYDPIACFTAKEGVDLRYVASLLFDPIVEKQISAMYLDFYKGNMLAYMSTFLNSIIVPNHSPKEQSEYLANACYDALYASQVELRQENEFYRKAVRMRKHALTQSLTSIEAMFYALNSYRIKQNGELHDGDNISRSQQKTVREAFEFISQGLKDMLPALDHIASVEYSFGESEWIDPEKFIENYIKKNEKGWLNFKPEITWEKGNNQAHKDWEDHTGRIILKKGDSINMLLFPPKALEQILYNIISNAQSHGFNDESRKDYNLRFSWHTDGLTLGIEVENNGSPIPADRDVASLLEYGVSTDLHHNGHNGIGCNEIDDIMHRYDGNVKIVSSPDKEFTVKYVLTFNHSIIRSIL